MRIHEYQAKRLLKSYGIPIPRGVVAFTVDDAEAAARFLGGGRWAIKAQIQAGGRGQAGGILFADSVTAVRSAAESLLGKPLRTAQTSPAGVTVKRLYVEAAQRTARELYLGIYVDRMSCRLTLVGAPGGGMGVETAIVERPESVTRLAIDLRAGLSGDAAAGFALRIGAGEGAREAVAQVARGICRAFIDLDASLIEINPLAVLDDDSAMALDARMMLDDNALFRHPSAAALADDHETSAIELEAARHEINYVAMDGNVGCAVNGAGLGMATLDLLKLRGVAPANFMDIRPVATRDQVATGFRMLLSNPALACIFVNIFGGGIMRCDLVAEGMVLAARQAPLRVPLVVRFAGTNAEVGRKLLVNAGLAANFATGLAEAATKVARIVTRGGGGTRRPSAAARSA